MRAWILQRREWGAHLPEPLQVVAAPGPLELLVQEVTDQGKRRLAKVARLYAPETKAIVAELLHVRMVWFKGNEFVLSGSEVIAGELRPLHAAQSWLCKLALPHDCIGYSARFLFRQGVALPWAEINGRFASVTQGRIHVASVLDDMLGRHTARAIVRGSGADHVLTDCELDFMGPERFQISGFEHHGACAGTPARLLRQGWLMEFDIQTPEQLAYVRSLMPKPER